MMQKRSLLLPQKTSVAAEEIPDVATEEISSVATGEISYVATEEIYSVAAEVFCIWRKFHRISPAMGTTEPHLYQATRPWPMEVRGI